MTKFYIGQRYFAGHLGGNICVVFILKAYFIVSDIPDDKIADLTLVNAMLVRASGAIESIATVPALRAEDAVPQMQKAQQMASTMTYQAPTKS